MGLPGRERNLTMTMPSAVWIQYTNVADRRIVRHRATAKAALTHTVTRKKMGNAPLLFPSFLSLPLSSPPSPIAKRHPENQLWGLGSAATPPATPRPQTHFGVFSAPKLHVAATLLHKLPMKKNSCVGRKCQNGIPAFQKSSGTLFRRVAAQFEH